MKPTRGNRINKYLASKTLIVIDCVMTDTAPKPFVFVLMPFDEALNDVYQLGIKEACLKQGAYCERVDEQIFQKETILTRIYNQIAKADIIVADMTGRNPNVFYEVGYAHALNKQVILLTQKEEDIPFDLKHYAHVIYSGIICQLKEDLGRRIRWLIDNPEKRLETVDKNVELFIGGIQLEALPKYEIAGGGPLKVDIYNPTSRVIPANSLIIGVIVNKSVVLDIRLNSKFINLPDGRILYPIPIIDVIFPSAWATIIIGLFRQPPLLNNSREIVTFRVFSEIAYIDHSVIVVFS